jgi:hypothetical protein
MQRILYCKKEDEIENCLQSKKKALSMYIKIVLMTILSYISVRFNLLFWINKEYAGQRIRLLNDCGPILAFAKILNIFIILHRLS